MHLETETKLNDTTALIQKSASLSLTTDLFKFVNDEKTDRDCDVANPFEWMRDVHEQVIEDENSDDNGFKSNVGKMLKRYVSAGNIATKKSVRNQDTNTRAQSQVEMSRDIVHGRSESPRL